MSRAALAAVLALGAAAAAQGQPADTQYVIEQLTVAVVAEPDGSGDHLATLHSGDAVQVLERQAERSHVRLASGVEGWVRSSYLMAGPPLRQQLQERTHELEALKQQLAGLEGELAQARAHAAPAAPSAPEAASEPHPADTPLFSGLGTTLHPGWLGVGAAALLGLAGGFLLGWRILDGRIRRKYGGLRIY